MKRRNTDQMMKITLLSTLLLGCLLVMTVQGDSSAGVVPAVTVVEEGNKNKLGVSSQKEPFVRSGAGHVRKLGLGGKKFGTNEVTSVDSKNGKGAYGGETSKISGKDDDGLKKSSGSRDQKNDDQKLMMMGPKEYLKSTKFFVVPRRIPTSTYPKSCSQDCNIAVPVKSSLGSSSSSHEHQISEETPQKDETQRFSDAAKEIANMMNKDYHGRPSHRSPINNNEPRN
ncbi:hypothetical protein JHK87_022329 [Glycine soja]|nr:hypothetical protein JHK87_022329 [Glycine soja]